MPPPKLNLDRFKRNAQGLLDFVSLMEQAPPAQQKRLVEQVSAVEPEFLNKVLRKVIFFEELIYLEEGALTELMTQMNPKILAYALYKIDPEFRKLLLKGLGQKEQRAVAEEEEKFGEGKVDPGAILGAQKQVIKTARMLEIKNGLSLELENCPRLKTKTLMPEWKQK